MARKSLSLKRANLLPIWLLVVANVYFGLHTEVTVGLATQAAHELMGLAP